MRRAVESMSVVEGKGTGKWTRGKVDSVRLRRAKK